MLDRERNTLRLIRCTLVAVLSAASLPASEAGWTRFRGPGGAGISTATTIPVTWTEKDFNWKAALPGSGHSSPVIWGDKIFVTSTEGKDAATRIILCLRTTDGSILWQRRFPVKGHRLNRDNSYASSTPAVGPKGVYVHWTEPSDVAVVALDHAGKDLWRRSLGAFDSMHGGGSSPIVYDGLVVICNDQKGKSSLLALDSAAGTTRWCLDRQQTKAAYSTPCVYEPPGGPAELIFTCTSHGITSVDPANGTVNWEYGEAFPQRVVCSPVVASGLIVGTSGAGGVGRRFVAVRPGSRKKGAKPELVYEFKRKIPYVPTPLAKGDLLFHLTDQGLATCLRAATGTVVWQESLGAKFYSSFVWVDGRLYAMSREGEMFVLATGDTFKLLARNPLGEPSHATPAVAGGVMYLRTFSHLIAIGGAK